MRLTVAGAPGSEVMVGARLPFFEKGSKKVEGTFQEVVDQESAAYGGTTVAVQGSGSATNFVALVRSD